MEFKYKKHLTIAVDLEVGEQVTIEGWGYKFDGKKLTIEDIILSPNKCESGVQVKVSGYDRYIDSNWITKI